MTDRKHKAALVIAALLNIFAAPALIMLCLGAAHSHYAKVPALGYWAVFFLAFAWRFLNTKTRPMRVRIAKDGEA